jgi:predicted GIY-YIG superfamily endonuclease
MTDPQTLIDRVQQNAMMNVGENRNLMSNRRTYYTYMLSNANRHIYVGMTNNLNRRLNEHKTAKRGFTGAVKSEKLKVKNCD